MTKDTLLQQAVLAELAWEPRVTASHIGVSADNNGWITLSGDVDWNFEKEAAEDACRPMLGVVSVLNQIAIRPRVNASNIHEKIMIALHRSWYEPVKIKVTADGGKVRLTGSVRTWYERQEAETAAWGAPGVTMVDDAIIID